MTKRDEIESVGGLIDALENALGDLMVTSSDLAAYDTGIVNVQRGFETLKDAVRDRISVLERRRDRLEE